MWLNFICFWRGPFHADVDIEMFGLHELILYVFEDYFSELLCNHSEDIEMFGLHELSLYAFEAEFSMKLCIHSEDMEMFVLRELILYVL